MPDCEAVDSKTTTATLTVRDSPITTGLYANRRTYIHAVAGLYFVSKTHEDTPRITGPITFSLTKDPTCKVTLFPIHDPSQPQNLLKVILHEINYVIDEGTTSPYHETMDLEQFVKYRFATFVAILVDGDHLSLSDPDLQGKPEALWKNMLLGTFYVKSKYTRRCSHVGIAGFVVDRKAMIGVGQGIGCQILGVGATIGIRVLRVQLGIRGLRGLFIGDSRGFHGVGYVKNVVVLNGEINLVDAYMYGKDLG